MAKRKKKKKKAKKRKKIIKKKSRSRKPKLRKKKVKKLKVNNKSTEKIYKVKSEWLKKALVSKNVYEKKYNHSLKDNDGFWRKEGKRVTWVKPYTKIKDVKYSSSEVNIKWFYDGTLNASANCIDRHLKNNKDKTAIMWVGDDPKVQKKITYKQLHNEVCKIANGLKEIGVQKGDRVTILSLIHISEPTRPY